MGNGLALPELYIYIHTPSRKGKQEWSGFAVKNSEEQRALSYSGKIVLIVLVSALWKKTTISENCVIKV